VANSANWWDILISVLIVISFVLFCISRFLKVQIKDIFVAVFGFLGGLIGRGKSRIDNLKNSEPKGLQDLYGRP